MVYSTHIKRLSSQRACVLTAAALLSGALVAGCGGSSHSPTAATLGDATSSRPSSASSGSGALAFANCMRANGVPNFPDPQPGGGELFEIPAGANPAAPPFRAARAKCQKLLPNGGASGSGPPPSDQTLAKLVRIARCMHQHGISDFPDPRILAPASFPPGIAEIVNFDGAVLVFPQTLNMQRCRPRVLRAPVVRASHAHCWAHPVDR
jgi:hypothetical protein